MYADWQSLGVALAGLYEARRDGGASAIVLLAPAADNLQSQSQSQSQPASILGPSDAFWEPSVPRRMTIRELGRIRCRRG